MKAMVLEAPNTPFVLKQVPDPEPGPGEAVARVRGQSKLILHLLTRVIVRPLAAQEGRMARV